MACRLTERSFHVIGRTGFGIPDQLSFRNSSIGRKKNRTEKIRVRNGSKASYHIPSVSLGVREPHKWNLSKPKL